MGFKQIKHDVIHCLENGNVLHEQRNSIDIKNLLATGEVSTREVIAVLKRANGNQHQSSPHHYDATITVHIVKTNHAGVDWYIKWYFDKPNSVFISVHH